MILGLRRLTDDDYSGLPPARMCTYCGGDHDQCHGLHPPTPVDWPLVLASTACLICLLWLVLATIALALSVAS